MACGGASGVEEEGPGGSVPEGGVPGDHQARSGEGPGFAHGHRHAQGRGPADQADPGSPGGLPGVSLPLEAHPPGALGRTGADGGAPPDLRAGGRDHGLRLHGVLVRHSPPSQRGAALRRPPPEDRRQGLHPGQRSRGYGRGGGCVGAALPGHRCPDPGAPEEPVGSVHHLHAPAGSGQAAGLLRQAHDDHGPAALRRCGHRIPDGGSHHLHADRFHPGLGIRRGSRPGLGPEAVRGGPPPQEPPELRRQAGLGCPGSPRSGASHRRGASPGRRTTLPGSLRGPVVRAHLAALRGQPDGPGHLRYRHGGFRHPGLVGASVPLPLHGFRAALRRLHQALPGRHGSRGPPEAG